MEKNASLLDEQILDNNPNLIVVKSISKSFGVPGLRLRVLATHNAELINAIKRMLPYGISIPLESFICRFLRSIKVTMKRLWIDLGW